MVKKEYINEMIFNQYADFISNKIGKYNPKWSKRDFIIISTKSHIEFNYKYIELECKSTKTTFMLLLDQFINNNIEVEYCGIPIKITDIFYYSSGIKYTIIFSKSLFKHNGILKMVNQLQRNQ